LITLLALTSRLLDPNVLIKKLANSEKCEGKYLFSELSSNLNISTEQKLAYKSMIESLLLNCQDVLEVSDYQSFLNNFRNTLNNLKN